ncbi:Phage capsid scaffolding protein (GPO) serine peptidase [compost metagenome]
MDALGKSKDKAVKDDAQFSELTKAIEALATHAQEQGEAFTAEQKERQELTTKLTKLETELSDLVKRLGITEDHSQKSRPVVPGGNGQALTTY